jgi:hypothetical protein
VLVSVNDPDPLGEPIGRWEDVPPDPGALIESMRAFGYSLPTAIADLVDNSISARATRIDIRLHWAGELSWIAVLDNGDGMDAETLTSAMRLGSRNPEEVRAVDDLGRFGLGLKTASFSQARSLTVASRRHEGTTVVRRWDLDQVVASRRWSLMLDADEHSADGIASLADHSRGTVVVLTSLDRLSGGAAADDEHAQTHFLRHAEAVSRHLAMTFHRFLSHKDLEITVDGRQVIGWDPFMTAEGQVQIGPAERLRVGNGVVDVLPHVLPHFSRLTTEQHVAAAGPLGWNQHQGFYVYRAGRLLVDGGWLGLPIVSEEHYKLARIRIDLDNSMDHDWQIDVRKATARIPRPLVGDMRRIATATRQKAAKAYRHRGRRLAGHPTAGAATGVWDARTSRGLISYRIDRDHPVIHAVLAGAGAARPDLERVLRLVEETVPLASIVMDSRERPDSTAGAFDGREGELAQILRAGFDALVANGVMAADALRILGAREPFNEHPTLLASLAEQEHLE